MAEQRTKEIGIRKANGANIKNIIMLFSKEFIQLVLISGIKPYHSHITFYLNGCKILHMQLNFRSGYLLFL